MVGGCSVVEENYLLHGGKEAQRWAWDKLWPLGHSATDLLSLLGPTFKNVLNFPIIMLNHESTEELGLLLIQSLPQKSHL